MTSGMKVLQGLLHYDRIKVLFASMSACSIKVTAVENQEIFLSFKTPPIRAIDSLYLELDLIESFEEYLRKFKTLRGNYFNLIIIYC